MINLRCTHEQKHTQNAVPSERVAVKGKCVGVVSRDDCQSLFLIGQLQSAGYSFVKGNRLMQRHGGATVVVSLINTTTCGRT